MNRQRQNRSALLYAATLVAVAASGCADGSNEDQLQGNGDELEQSDGPAVVGSSRDETPSTSNAGTPAVTSVTRQPVVPGGPTVGSEGPGRVTRQPTAGGLSGPYFAEVKANGTGCPAGSWDAAISPDAQTFTVTFNSYSARVNPENRISVKDCQLEIKLKSPSQISYAVQNFRFSGYAYLEQGVNARQETKFYVQGNPGNSIDTTADLNGPYNAPYTVDADVELGKKLWSPCSAERALNVSTRLRLDNREKRNGFINLAAVKGTAKMVMRISWRKCDDTDEIGKPSTDDGTSGPSVIDVDRDDNPQASGPTGGPAVVGVDRDSNPTSSGPTSGPAVVGVERDSSPTSSASGVPAVVSSERTEI